MNCLNILFFSSLLFSCTERNSRSNNNINSSQFIKDVLSNRQQENDTFSWINSFRQFRNAVYQRDKNKLNAFIDFPIMNENNEIWYLVLEGDEKAMKMVTNKIKPFTESDFRLYFDKLFTNDFVKSILKIKTEDIFLKGESQTSVLKSNEDASIQMRAYFDKPNKTVTLNLSTTVLLKNTGDVGEEKAEYNIIYEFSILENAKLKFRQVRLAG